ERRVAVDTCLREATSERLGTSSTSSYVSPWGRKSAIVVLPDNVSGSSQMAPPAVAPSSVTPRPAPPYIITRLVLAALQCGTNLAPRQRETEPQTNLLDEHPMLFQHTHNAADLSELKADRLPPSTDDQSDLLKCPFRPDNIVPS